MAELAMDPPAGRPQTEPGGAPRITLLTDFGTADGYVAALRGVLATLAPHALVEDASHAIPPGDVHAAAWALAAYWNRYPPGTIHVVVVDPGVGSARRALAGTADGRHLVAPDNGVLTRVLDAAEHVALHAVEDPRFIADDVSATFHGRDIFAPAAAHLARATPAERFGPAVADPVRLELPVPLRSDQVVQGQVVHVDRFGTLVTNVPEAWLAEGVEVAVDGAGVGPVRRTFQDVDPGRPVALVGSAGVLEVAVRDGSAARVLRKGRGAEVTLSPA